MHGLLIQEDKEDSGWSQHTASQWELWVINMPVGKVLDSVDDEDDYTYKL